MHRTPVFSLTTLATLLAVTTTVTITVTAQTCGHNILPAGHPCPPGMKHGDRLCDPSCRNINSCFKGNLELSHECFPGRCRWADFAQTAYCAQSDADSPFLSADPDDEDSNLDLVPLKVIGGIDGNNDGRQDSEDQHNLADSEAVAPEETFDENRETRPAAAKPETSPSACGPFNIFTLGSPCYETLQDTRVCDPRCKNIFVCSSGRWLLDHACPGTCMWADEDRSPYCV